MFEQSVMVPGDVRYGMEVAPVSGGLPTASQILSSFQGRRFTDHEILRAAHALAALHSRRATMRDAKLVAAVDDRRRELVDDIDEWVVERALHRDEETVIHTETLGAVIDRMAWGWAEANRPIDSAEPRINHVRKRWQRLAELVDGYTDLIAEIIGGRRRLPH
ncbi:DUF4254 domain-containing protein [Nocardia sp. NBC_00416]|uniref:DUF4254 domain-containing protein n=1 Tax=Nocardia sp. NBC_00416 TaxID=2975991 RepID=UPI002E1F5F48